MFVVLSCQKDQSLHYFVLTRVLFFVGIFNSEKSKASGSSVEFDIGGGGNRVALDIHSVW